jgi:hypothetical protein
MKLFGFGTIVLGAIASYYYLKGRRLKQKE